MLKCITKVFSGLYNAEENNNDDFKLTARSNDAWHICSQTQDWCFCILTNLSDLSYILWIGGRHSCQYGS
jgi:hypothetical protein